MSTDRHLARVVEQWLDDGPTHLADPVLLAALREVGRTPQRRRLPVPRRIRPASLSRRLATITAAVAVIAVAALVVANGAPALNTGGPSSLPLLAPATTPAPSASAASSVPAPSLAAELLAPLGYPGAGTIVFSRVPQGGADVSSIWRVAPSGGSEAPLRVSQGFDGRLDLAGTGCCAVLSPDGRQVAVGYYDMAGDTGGATLLRTDVLALDGTVIRQLPVCGGCGYVIGLNYQPEAWSPDGRWLAVGAWNDSDPSKAGINLIPIGSQPGVGWTSQVTGNSADVAVAFSPDSRQLLFVRNGASGVPGPLMVLDVASGAVRQLSPEGMLVFASGYSGGGASWAPDGRHVAYAATDASGNTNLMTVYVQSPAGGAPVAIAGPRAYVNSAQWSPDGQWIAYDRPVSGSGPHVEVVVHPDGTGERTLSAVAGMCCGRWSPDSRALVTVATAGAVSQSVLFIVPIDGSGAWQVTTIPGRYEDVSWSPATP